MKNFEEPVMRLNRLPSGFKHEKDDGLSAKMSSVQLEYLDFEPVIILDQLCLKMLSNTKIWNCKLCNIWYKHYTLFVKYMEREDAHHETLESDSWSEDNNWTEGEDLDDLDEKSFAQ